MFNLESKKTHAQLSTTPASRAHALYAVAAASMLLLAACAPVAPAPASTVPATATPLPAQAASTNIVTIAIDNTGMTMPGEVASGPVTFAIENSTAAGGSPMVARFVEGKTVEDLMAALGAMETAGPGALFDVVVLYGGAEGPAVSEMTLNLVTGSHIALLLGEGAPQFATFEVVEGEAGAAPTASVEVVMKDFTFLMPDTIAAGAQSWRFANEGNQWHETVIYKMEEGQSIEELMEAAAAAGPEGGEGAPEMAAVWTPMSQGEEGWATLDLAAGTYAVICFLPDLTGDMSPHFAHGMVRTLIVE